MQFYTVLFLLFSATPASWLSTLPAIRSARKQLHADTDFRLSKCHCVPKVHLWLPADMCRNFCWGQDYKRNCWIIGYAYSQQILVFQHGCTNFIHRRGSLLHILSKPWHFQSLPLAIWSDMQWYPVVIFMLHFPDY